LKTYERRYHAGWALKHGFSPLSKLGTWMVQHQAKLAAAPWDLLVAAVADVAMRLPMIAAREPTRRHRKHFAWLLGWHVRLASALKQKSAIGEAGIHAS
jgi:hypothetical protein